MEEKEKLKQKFQEHADKVGIILNPDTKAVEEIIDKLLIRKEKNGDTYCPCRFVSGNKERDADTPKPILAISSLPFTISPFVM